MEAESPLYSELFLKSTACILCLGSFFSEHSLSPCTGYTPFVSPHLLGHLSNLVHSLWRSKTEGEGNQAVYFPGFFPSELQSSLSLSKRLWLLSVGQLFSQGYPEEVFGFCDHSLLCPSRFGSPNCCLLSPVTGS